MLYLLDSLMLALVSGILYKGIRDDPDPGPYIRYFMYLTFALTGANIVSFIGTL